MEPLSQCPGVWGAEDARVPPPPAEAGGRQTRGQCVLNELFKSWEGWLIQTYLAAIALVD